MDWGPNQNLDKQPTVLSRIFLAKYHGDLQQHSRQAVSLPILRAGNLPQAAIPKGDNLHAPQSRQRLYCWHS